MGNYMLIIYVVAFIAIFYFMAIRPQQRQRKAHAALLASLKKGDSVVTSAGIYGKVKRVEENLVVVEVAKGVNMKIARRAVVEIIRDKAQARRVAPERASSGRDRRARAEIEEQDFEEIEEYVPDEGEEEPAEIEEEFEEEPAEIEEELEEGEEDFDDGEEQPEEPAEIEEELEEGEEDLDEDEEEED